MPRPALAAVLLSLAGFAVAPRGEAADAPPATPAADAVAVLAGIEHRRGDAAGLDPWLSPDAAADLRARAVTALGRLGDRPGVEERLRALLRRGGPEIAHVLWAAGVSGVEGLVPDVLPWLDRDPQAEREVVLAALRALGALGDRRASGYAAAFLDAKDPALLVAGLDALWRLGGHAHLERVLALADADPTVRLAAAVAAWRLAGARRMALPAEQRPAFDASALASGAPLRWSKDADAPTRLFALRAINAMLPERLDRAGAAGSPASSAEPQAALLAAVEDADPRVAADAAFRLGGAHTGPDVGSALARGLRHADPLVRETAADALATLAGKDGPSAKEALAGALERESDARVQQALRRALAATGDEAVVGAAVAPRKQPLSPEAWKDAVEVVAACRAPFATAHLVALLERADLPPAARAVALDALSEREPEARFVARAAPFLADADPGVRAAAAAVLARHAARTDGADDDAVTALVAAYHPDAGRADVDGRQAVVAALGEIATAPGTPASAVAAATKALEAALKDPAPTVRLAARERAARLPALAEAARAPDPQPNEWRGLPRPKAPVLGLDLTQGDPWLSEAEILRLAQEIERLRPTVVLETTQGAIRLALDAAHAPVHAVNLVLCAAAGVYDGTPWHRVVPAFVIQGGDPRGDGSGDAGYSIPDEITATRFERGVLGMPKSTKDTGGCQVFLMHVAAPHLDGGYTAYGRAVEGLEAIDRIRVGDRITKARVEVPGR